MKPVSDYNFSRISAFVDGELSTDEVNCLISDMKKEPELKELYFNLIEISEASQKLKPIGYRQQIANTSLTNLLAS